MTLSVIIVTFNSGPYLRRCLRSLETNLAGLDWEACVVDNASQDGSLDQIQSEFPWVRLIANSKNLGFAPAVNQGLRQTTGRYVLWLNPDAELLDKGFGILLRYLEEHPAVGILGAQLKNPHGDRQLSCRSFPSYRTAFFHRYALLSRLFPSNRWSRAYLHSDWSGDRIQEVDWVSGACLLHRREVSDHLEGVDERFFMYCEDVDFCLRAKQKGWATFYHPAAQVLHQIGGSTRQIRRRMTLERHRSMWRYYRKHFRPNPLKDLFVGAVLWARCGLIILRRGD